MPEPVQKTALLEAILPHVAFDGWSEESFRAAAQDLGLSIEDARGFCPRGAVDLAVAYHKRGDEKMIAALAEADLSEMRFRDRVAHAVRLRLEAVEDVEVVRRGSALFALPTHAAEGAKLIWGTADAIWVALGDSSTDINWYTKRTTLSAVYGSSVLYWLGDDSADKAATWAFVDRRIDNVMQFEKIKAAARKNPLFGRLAAGPGKIFDRVEAPGRSRRTDLPGSLRGTE